MSILGLRKIRIKPKVIQKYLPSNHLAQQIQEPIIIEVSQEINRFRCIHCGRCCKSKTRRDDLTVSLSASGVTKFFNRGLSSFLEVNYIERDVDLKPSLVKSVILSKQHREGIWLCPALVVDTQSTLSKCTAYKFRPVDCVLYPFNFQETYPGDITSWKLALIEKMRCPTDAFNEEYHPINRNWIATAFIHYLRKLGENPNDSLTAFFEISRSPWKGIQAEQAIIEIEKRFYHEEADLIKTCEYTTSDGIPFTVKWIGAYINGTQNEIYQKTLVDSSNSFQKYKTDYIRTISSDLGTNLDIYYEVIFADMQYQGSLLVASAPQAEWQERKFTISDIIKAFYKRRNNPDLPISIAVSLKSVTPLIP